MQAKKDRYASASRSTPHRGRNVPKDACAGRRDGRARPHRPAVDASPPLGADGLCPHEAVGAPPLLSLVMRRRVREPARARAAADAVSRGAFPATLSLGTPTHPDWRSAASKTSATIARVVLGARSARAGSEPSIAGASAADSALDRIPESKRDVRTRLACPGAQTTARPVLVLGVSFNCIASLVMFASMNRLRAREGPPRSSVRSRKTRRRGKRRKSSRSPRLETRGGMNSVCPSDDVRDRNDDVR
jgi:hypothetical protein